MALLQATLDSEAERPLGHARQWEVKAHVSIPKFSWLEYKTCSQAGTSPSLLTRPLDGLGTCRDRLRNQHRLFHNLEMS